MTEQEAAFIQDCIELQFKKVLNSEYHKDNELMKLLSLIVKVSVHFALNLTDDIQSKLKEYNALLNELYLKKKDSVPKIAHILLLSFYVLQGLFLKENWLGKSYLYHDADYRLKQEAEVKLKELGMAEKIKKRVVDTFDYNVYFEQCMGHKLEGANLNNYSYEFIKSPTLIEHRSESKHIFSYNFKLFNRTPDLSYCGW